MSWTVSPSALNGGRPGDLISVLGESMPDLLKDSERSREAVEREGRASLFPEAESPDGSGDAAMVSSLALSLSSPALSSLASASSAAADSSSGLASLSLAFEFSAASSFLLLSFAPPFFAFCFLSCSY